MKANGHDIKADAGLTAVKASFADAQYQSIDARDCALLMMRGAHRKLEIPDAVIMEAYGMICCGNKVQLKFKTKAGKGYLAQIESYADLIKFMQGELDVAVLVAT